MKKIYKSGLDIFLEKEYKLVKGKRVGLVTNHSGLTVDFKANVDQFFSHPEIDLMALYGPEHGVRGNIKAGVDIEDNLDPITGLPVYSLYGDSKKPDSSMLKEIDVMIYDLQDLGLRYYTYISTLFYCLESCGENNKEMIVLDRLNPLGRKIEGSITEDEFKSFVGLYPIPQRHGMTVGELAAWAVGEFDINIDLKVVGLEGWQGEYFDEMDLLWVPPSPNIPQFETALVYPITCMFEGTNISEGRGTVKPFEYIGAPWIEPYILVRELNKQVLPGVKYRPIFFEPTYSKYEGRECGGVQIYVEDRDKVNSNLTGLTILKAIKDLYPDKFQWKKSKDGKYFFDLLMGSDKVRTTIDSGKEPYSILDGWQTEEEKFNRERRRYLIYQK